MSFVPAVKIRIQPTEICENIEYTHTGSSDRKGGPAPVRGMSSGPGPAPGMGYFSQMHSDIALDVLQICIAFVVNGKVAELFIDRSGLKGVVQYEIFKCFFPKLDTDVTAAYHKDLSICIHTKIGKWFGIKNSLNASGIPYNFFFVYFCLKSLSKTMQEDSLKFLELFLSLRTALCTTQPSCLEIMSISL